MSTSAPRRTASFSETLLSGDDERLVTLLARRPDLATPAPSSLLSLVARASSRTSLERALAGRDALELQVLETVLVLDPVSGPVPVDAVAGALGTDDDPQPAARALSVLEEHALVWTPGGPPGTAFRPAPGLAEILGPYPAGLGPTGGPDDLALPFSLPADAPPGAAAVLDALAWGPPVGVAPRSDPAARRAVSWLVEHGLLHATDDRHVVLPREVGLALRGGRTHRDVRTAPPVPDGPVLGAATVDAESATAGLEVVRLVARLVTTWPEAPPGILRSGGLGVRDLRRAAATLEVDDTTAVAVVELAAAAGLVADDRDDPPSFTATDAAEDWLGDGLGERWAALARGWSRSRRTPWLVGSRDEKGALRSALDPELWRPWVPRLRTAVLDVLADAPGRGLRPDDVVAALRWRTPRAVPPEQAVVGLLREAELLGVTGAGAISTPGRALLAEHDTDPAAGPSAPRESPAGPAEAFASVLPAAVDELLLQGDLTGIVPGRPSAALERLVEVAADVESRGAATTVRFGAASVVRALDHGRTADDLLTELAAHSRTPVPQPLEYLVRDTARRHGRVRVGAASSYVRAEDPALLAGLVEAAALRHLGLVQIAPTVLVAAVPAGELQAALRERGVVSAVEGPDGRVLVADGTRRRRAPDGPGRTVVGRRRRPGQPDGRAAGAGPGTDGAGRPARSAELVARLRAADRADRDPTPATADDDGPAAPGAPRAGLAARTGPPGAPTADGAPGPAASGPEDDVPAPAGTRGTTDPVGALGLLRESIADGTMVWLEVVGTGGFPTRRRVRPLTLDAGRLRAQDPARDAELTVAVHRIASVTPDQP
ncbi:helicase-associated domain-containing protein [Cellulosimicrobium arenosum]|uniref:Helicase-associated domain-containing protein n=1 Tax=Cellulosimicrobium arenosum TaxID=2708133 RepID=A0A927G8Y2_9MICO|nr:helicase-associated domain-containing protein [Cellulosimicrobium arenosum]MBD8079051.1 helicase-associated domain-containing protein [Cellulosimicrobium arenosum]